MTRSRPRVVELQTGKLDSPFFSDDLLADATIAALCSSGYDGFRLKMSVLMDQARVEMLKSDASADSLLDRVYHLSFNLTEFSEITSGIPLCEAEISMILLLLADTEFSYNEWKYGIMLNMLSSVEHLGYKGFLQQLAFDLKRRVAN